MKELTMDQTRRPDIDALRVFATYLLFAFHVGKVFDPAPFFHIRNAELSFAMLVFCGFVSLWHMPLFFLLAGWSLHRSTERRGAAGVVRERVGRLLVPLAAGIVLFMPILKYLELSSGLELETSDPPLLSKPDVVRQWRLCKGEVAEAAFRVAEGALKAAGTSGTGNTQPAARALRDMAMGLVQAFPAERGRLEAASMYVSAREQALFGVKGGKGA